MSKDFIVDIKSFKEGSLLVLTLNWRDLVAHTHISCIYIFYTILCVYCWCIFSFHAWSLYCILFDLCHGYWPWKLHETFLEVDFYLWPLPWPLWIFHNGRDNGSRIVSIAPITALVTTINFCNGWLDSVYCYRDRCGFHSGMDNSRRLIGFLKPWPFTFSHTSL